MYVSTRNLFVRVVRHVFAVRTCAGSDLVYVRLDLDHNSACPFPRYNKPVGPASLLRLLLGCHYKHSGD